MPRWARFLSCGFTGLLLSLSGFFLAASYLEPRPDFWGRLQEFMTTPPFWALVWQFAGVAAMALLLGRLLVNLHGLWGGTAGFLAGAAMALAYIAFLLSTQVDAWGGLSGAWPRLWPAGGYMALPLALSTGFATWLWDRFD